MNNKSDSEPIFNMGRILGFTFTDHYDPTAFCEKWFGADVEAMLDPDQHFDHFKATGIAIVETPNGKNFAIPQHSDDQVIPIKEGVPLKVLTCKVFQDEQGRHYFCLCEKNPMQSGSKMEGEMKGSESKNSVWLSAIGEGVVQFAGPLGAPLKLLLEKYKDEKMAERERTLNDLYQSSVELNSELVEKIFEVQIGMVETRKVLIEFVKDFVNGSINKNIPQRIEQGKVEQYKIWEEKKLRNELMSIFSGNPTALSRIAEDNGFPIELIQWQAPSSTVISEFVKNCNFQNPEVLFNVFSELFKRYSGSGTIEKVYFLLKEYCEEHMDCLPSDLPSNK